MQWLRNLAYREKIPSLEKVRYQFEQTPSLTNRLRLGQALHDAEKYQEGADLFSKVLETQPKERDALFGLGLCKIGLNELEEAVGIFEQLIESDRTFNDYEPWILLSQSLWGLGRQQEALELLDRLVKTSPRTRHAVTHAHFQLEAGHPDKAHAILRQALEHYEHAPKFVKRNDRPWARQAKKMIKAVGPGQTAGAQ
jgi:tetratricopeptide (TPR) repeat protein